MTLNDLIPAPLRGNGIRRAVDKVAELRDENVRLLNRQAAADDYFALLIQDRDQVYAAWRFAQKGRQGAEAIVVDQENQIRDLKRQLGEAKRRLEIGVLAEAAAAQTQEIDTRDLRERFAAGPVVDLHQSPRARLNPVHVPAWVKDEPDPAA